MLFLLLTLLVATAGGIFALRRKMPAGAMLGAMLAVGMLNIATGRVVISVQYKVFTQAMAGGFVGLGMTRQTLRELQRLMFPALFLMVWMQLQGVLVGFLVHHFSSLDLVTALVACAPGGIVDMSLLAADMGADAAVVALLHTVRLSTVMLLFPFMVKPLVKRFGQKQPPVVEPVLALQSAQESQEPLSWWVRCLQQAKQGFPTILLAVGGGLAGYRIGMPAGALLFSMIAVSAYSLGTHKAYIPPKLRRAAQILAGAIIGQNLGMEQLWQLKELVLPAVLIVSIYLGCNIILGLLLSRLFGLDLATGLFASSPAGASDMALIASEMGGASASVSVLHVVRLISVIALYPQIISFFLP